MDSHTDRLATEVLTHLRAEVQRLTAERDAAVAERDEARREVKALRDWSGVVERERDFAHGVEMPDLYEQATRAERERDAAVAELDALRRVVRALDSETGWHEERHGLSSWCVAREGRHYYSTTLAGVFRAAGDEPAARAVERACESEVKRVTEPADEGAY